MIQISKIQLRFHKFFHLTHSSRNFSVKAEGMLLYGRLTADAQQLLIEMCQKVNRWPTKDKPESGMFVSMKSTDYSIPDRSNFRRARLLLEKEGFILAMEEGVLINPYLINCYGKKQLNLINAWVNPTVKLKWNK